jgi:hypothetical protein
LSHSGRTPVPDSKPTLDIPSEFGSPIRAHLTSFPFTPSRLSRHMSSRQSRSSSYSSVYPTNGSFGVTPDLKAESSQSSVIPSRPHSPDDFLTESDADAEWDYPRSRRGSQSARTDVSPSRPRRPTMSGETLNPSNLVSLETKAEMDRIFDIYLQQTCSDRQCCFVILRTSLLIPGRLQLRQQTLKAN